MLILTVENCGICSMQNVSQGFRTPVLEGRVGVIMQKGGLMHRGPWVVSWEKS